MTRRVDSIRRRHLYGIAAGTVERNGQMVVAADSIELDAVLPHLFESERGDLVTLRELAELRGLDGPHRLKAERDTGRLMPVAWMYPERGGRRVLLFDRPADC